MSAPGLRRVCMVAVMAALLTVTLAPPVLAHGGGAPDASNFVSAVDEVSAVDGDGDPVEGSEAPEGVTVEVLANDALLQVTNRTAAEVAVPGYDGEPYLRIGREGVWENRNSPAGYLNEDRYARTEPPGAASADAEPDWVKVADAPTYRWHDHRIHWMATTLPPQVKADPSSEQTVQQWRVPFRVGDEAYAAQGELRWVPGVAWWPWVLAALAATSVPVTVAAAVAGTATRRRAVLRTAAAVVAAVALVDLAHTVDDVVAMPATWSEDVYAFVESAAFIVIAAFGVRAAWRGGAAASTGLSIAAASLFGGLGLTHLASLTSSQVVSVVPVELTRVVVAANLAVIAPAALAAWYARERHAQPAPDPEPSPVATGGAA